MQDPESTILHSKYPNMSISQTFKYTDEINGIYTRGTRTRSRVLIKTNFDIDNEFVLGWASTSSAAFGVANNGLTPNTYKPLFTTGSHTGSTSGGENTVRQRYWLEVDASNNLNLVIDDVAVANSGTTNPVTVTGCEQVKIFIQVMNMPS